MLGFGNYLGVSFIAIKNTFQKFPEPLWVCVACKVNYIYNKCLALNNMTRIQPLRHFILLFPSKNYKPKINQKPIGNFFPATKGAKQQQDFNSATNQLYTLKD